MTAAPSADASTSDTLLDGRVQIFQPRNGYRVAIDPVLLAAAVQVPDQGLVLDAGCGTGAALFCVLMRLETVSGVGLENQPTLATLTRRGIEANGLQARARIEEKDIASAVSKHAGTFDAVLTNPPFFEVHAIRSAPKDAFAHTESTLSLEDWIHTCFRYLKHEGAIAIIHRTERLADIITVVNRFAGAVTIIPLWPKAGHAAKRVIVTARKGRKSPSAVHPGLVLHKENGDFTEDAEAVLRNGSPLVTSA